jgi:hypothetical protein
LDRLRATLVKFGYATRGRKFESCPPESGSEGDGFRRTPTMALPVYADLYSLTEDERIQVIGETVMRHRKTVAFVTDADPGKHNRYIDKLEALFPGIVILEKLKGPVANTVTVKVGPPAEAPGNSG